MDPNHGLVITETPGSSTTYLVCSDLSLTLEHLHHNTQLNHFELKTKLYTNPLKASFLELPQTQAKLGLLAQSSIWPAAKLVHVT